MWKYRPQLDGLRSVAVYLVLLYHCGPAALHGGFIGVDVFFVLSGFLVSNVILDEIDRTGTLSLGTFYARRVRRLLPAAVLVVVSTCVLYVLVAGLVQRLEIIGDARSALLYVANWHFLGQSNDYFSQDQQPSPFLHFWSLAIEEQFYVVFPVVLLLLSRSSRPVRATALGVAALGIASLGAQLFWMVRDTNHAYYGTDARLYQLLAGALLALLLRHRPRVVGDRQAAWLMLLGALGLVVLGSGLLDISPGSRGIAATGVTGAVILSTMVSPDGWLSTWLSRPTPVYLGKISYGTYLWHWPVILAVKELMALGSWEVAAIAVPVSTGLAAVSFQVLESPIRRTPTLNRLSWPVVAGGVALSLVVAGLVVSPVLQSTRRPAIVAAAATTAAGAEADDDLGSARVPDGIDWRAQVRDNGKGASCPADDVQRCIVVPGTGPRVLLVGDSLANMLAPMFVRLAEDHGFSLAQNIVQGCPWPEDLDDTSQTNKVRARCVQAREEWYERALRELEPDLVVLVMRPRDTSASWAGKVASRSGENDGTLEELTVRTMTKTVQHLERLAPQVLLVQGVMGTGDGPRPLDCLAEATRIRDCMVSYPLTSPPSDGYMETLAAESDRVSTIDLNPTVCPTAPHCLPYVQGQIVWRDRHHLMTGFAVSERQEVWELMEQVGATGPLEQRQ